MGTPLSSEQIKKMHAYWWAANYLTVGQIYLKDNPLLERPLVIDDVKPRLLGHWGTTSGLNFIYTHLNRLINEHDLNMIYVIGPGHGGPGIVAHTYLEGSYSEMYPRIGQDRDGIKSLFRQFSWPYGIPSHVAPETPGSIHEGGELGYSLLHAFGAAYDNPDLVVACVVGDGEAETGPCATSWHSTKFLDAARDGAVLPILHLNGYKIANPTVLARIPREELESLFRGYGYAPYFLEGDDPIEMHSRMAATLDAMLAEIQAIQKRARVEGETERPRWPMLILRTPKGWTGPESGGRQTGGRHLASASGAIGGIARETGAPENPRTVDAQLSPRRTFRRAGKTKSGNRRAGSQRAAAHGHESARQRRIVAEAAAAAAVSELRRGGEDAGQSGDGSHAVLGKYLRDVMKFNQEHKNFRVFGPDETASNRLQAILEVTGKTWEASTLPVDEHLAVDGRVMEILSEHMCEGWLEGYLLTGRHGFFSCYEAFIHIIDSMFNQHAKWLKSTREIPWRKPIASLNYLLSSHVWRQDHNGFSHQDPGFIDHVANKKADVVRIYLPPDANTLLSVADHCLRSCNYVNLIIAGKQPAPSWLNMDDAVRHCTTGMGIWEFASNDDGNPDVVMACAGDVPTLEILAAVSLLRERVPDLRIRVVNVVDLLALQPTSEHPHGLADEDFDALFTKDTPVIFAFHGYPTLIHRLTYRRRNHNNIHVRGYVEEGTTTTPFDMTVLNRMDRFRLALDVVLRVPRLAHLVERAKQQYSEAMQRHKEYVSEHGEDLPEIRNWKWSKR